MAFNSIANFISNLQFDGARPNLFDITLPFPTGVPNESQVLSFMAKAASLPPVEIGVAEVPYMGRKIKVMGNRTFPNWTITVLNDEDFAIRNAFETWSSNINAHVGNLLDAAYTNLSNYGSRITINQYDKHGNSIKEYDMVGAWPSSISAIDMAWDTNNVVEEYTVTLEYQWWEATTTDAS